MKRVLSAALVLAFITLVFAKTDSQQVDSRRGSDRTAADKVDALLAPWSKGDTPGVAVLVIKDGKVLLKKGYGLASLETKKPIGPDTAFLLGSITKPFTAMAIMILAERKKLHYDDPLSKFFPEFPPYAEKVTIRHLLNHTAGFPEYDDLFVKSGKMDSDWPRSAKSKPSRFEPTSKDALQILSQEKELQFTPGDQYKYSNSGYMILAQIVEKVSGKSFAQFLQQEIFQPLSMKRSRLYDETRPAIKNRATSYKLAEGVYQEIDYAPQNAVYGEDNIYTTVEDMYYWDQALSRNKLVSAATLKEAFTPGQLNNGETTNYGFGWFVRKTPGQDRLWHLGGWLGFRTAILRLPDLRFTVVVLSNLAQCRPGEIAGGISRIYLDDKKKLEPAGKSNPK
jgi:CubicO group peptidase (beta-lactamase class C family)